MSQQPPPSPSTSSSTAPQPRQHQSSSSADDAAASSSRPLDLGTQPPPAQHINNNEMPSGGLGGGRVVTTAPSSSSTSSAASSSRQPTTSNHFGVDVIDIVEQSRLPDTVTSAEASYNHQHTPDPVKRDQPAEQPFSLKHFLKRTPSTTTAAPTATPAASSCDAPPPPQPFRSTGARPKIPSSSSASHYHQHHHHQQPPAPTSFGHAVPTSASAYDTSTSARMKRSPKFSSFDSQAALAEFSASSSRSSPSCTSLPANAGHQQAAADEAASTAATASASSRHLPPQYVAAESTASAAPFQRSISTFDIGGGGRRHGLFGAAGTRRRQSRGDPFAGTRTTSMQGHQIIHDDDDDDDDGDDNHVHIDDYDDDGDEPSASFLDSQTRRALRAAARSGGGGLLSPDISAALPDFVQDHILLEHLYGAGGGAAATAASAASAAAAGASSQSHRHPPPPQQQQQRHLPDFTDVGARLAAHSSSVAAPTAAAAAGRTGSMPFDLMCSPRGGCEASVVQQQQQQRRRQPPNLPLDLPTAGGGRQRTAIYNEIPVDLTARSDRERDAGFDLVGGGGGRANAAMASQSAPQPPGPPPPSSSTVRTLPDFLADGHVHSAAASSSAGATGATGPVAAGAAASAAAVSEGAAAAAAAATEPTMTTVDSLRTENDRLRRELRHSQHLLQTQQQRGDQLAADAAVQQHSNGTRVAALQQQIRRLTDQLEAQRAENAILKEEGAVGGCSGGGATGGRDSPAALGAQRVIAQSSQELSRDMRLAAQTAENNLRQLLSGVDNLRLMATRIESLADLAVVDLDNVTTPSSSGSVGGGARGGPNYGEYK